MTEHLSAFGLNQDWGFMFSFGGLIMTRLLMIMTIIPFLVGKPVPSNIRIGLCLCFLFILYPALVPKDIHVMPDAPLKIFGLYVKEMFYGMAIGITASLVFHAFEAAGSMVDNQRGAAQARLLIPNLGETSIFGNLNHLLGIVIFIALKGHLVFFEAVFQSYKLLPLFDAPPIFPDYLAMANELARMSAVVLVLALQLTAPILISIFVTDVILGVISKAAPSMNVFEMGFAIRGVLGVYMYYLAIIFIQKEMGRLSLAMIDDVHRILRLLTLSQP